MSYGYGGPDVFKRRGAGSGSFSVTRGRWARLVERLIASLDTDPEIEEAWAAEVERRQDQLESGATKLRPGPETLAKLRAEFR